MTVVPLIEVLNGDQTVIFEGDLLGSASSELGFRDERRERWSEIEIYRTVDGKYVVVKIGKSRVVHTSQQCRTLRSNIDPPELIAGDLRGYAMCSVCHPNPQAGSLYLERPHSSAVVAEAPRGAVAACYSKDRNGLWFLTHNAEDALRDAFDRDRDLEQAFLRFDVTSLGRRKS